MNNNFIAVLLIFRLFFGVIIVFITLFFLAFYYSIFKRAKMYFQVQSELERVLEENDLALQLLRQEQAMLQQRDAQQQ
ncbi:hypothetical protein [Bartonella florencae]|uniref:hypothetical protein n=1 Tax=Bartonella florencae TaxID=928210 RepID=UPI000308728E|nr:hypothetical protein [Bartonella florencae]